MKLTWALGYSEVGPGCVVEVLDLAALARLHVAQRELAHRVVVTRHGTVEPNRISTFRDMIDHI